MDPTIRQAILLLSVATAIAGFAWSLTPRRLPASEATSSEKRRASAPTTKGRQQQLEFFEIAGTAAAVIDPIERANEITRVVSLWAIYDFDGASAWLNEQYATEELDGSVRGIALAIIQLREYDIALDWAESIRKKDTRDAVLAEIYASAIAAGAESYVARLEGAQLPEELTSAALSGDLLD